MNTIGAISHLCTITLGNRLQPKKPEDLVYVYTNLRLMAEGKEKDKKQWYVDYVDLGDSDSIVKKDIKIHGNLDLDGWDDGILRIQNLNGEIEYGLLLQAKFVYEI